MKFLLILVLAAHAAVFSFTPANSAAEINTALLDQNPPHTIELGPGTYVLSEKISVTSSETIIRGIGLPTLSAEAPMVGYSIVIADNVQNVVIQGIRFANAQINSGSLRLSLRSIATVEDCEFVDNNGTATVILDDSSTGKFLRCLFARNRVVSALSCGAAINAISGNPNVLIQQCDFLDNSIHFSGPVGGAVCIGNGGNAGGSANIQDSYFRGNTAIGTMASASENEGGALRISFRDVIGGAESQTIVSRCVFEGNSIRNGIQRGSAVFVSAYDGITFDTCLFLNNGNITSNAAGALVISALGSGGSTDALVQDCTFRGNVDQSFAGALGVGRIASNEAKVTCDRCFFQGNLPNHVLVGWADSGNCTLSGSSFAFADATETILIVKATLLAVNLTLDAESAFKVKDAAVGPSTCIVDAVSNQCDLAQSRDASGTIAMRQTTADALRAGLQGVQTAASTPLVIITNTNIVGSLAFLSNSSLVVSVGSLLTVSANVVVDVGAVITLSNVAAAGTYTIVTAGSTLILSPQAEVRASVLDPSCQTASGVTAQQSGLSVLVTVSTFDDTCGDSEPNGSSGLSTAAIIGIAVGASVAGIALVLLIVLLSVHRKRRLTDTTNARLKNTQMEQLQQYKSTN